MKRTLAMLVTLVAVALFVTAGCGDKTKKTDGKTKDGNGKTERPTGKPEVPPVKEEPAVKKEEPAIKKEEPAIKKEEPAIKKEEPVKLSEKLIGTWEGQLVVDDEKLKADLKKIAVEDGEEIDDATLEERVTQAKEIFGAIKITMTFNEDGTLVAEGGGPEGEESKGTWKVLDEEDTKLSVEVRPEDRPAEKQEYVFEGDDRFTTVPTEEIPGVKHAVFNRKK